MGEYSDLYKDMIPEREISKKAGGNKLTKWEVGQDLISISDYFAEKHSNIYDSISEQDRDKLLRAMALIGDVFNNDNNNHKFNIYDTQSYLKAKEALKR